MKKIFKVSLALLATLSLSVSCNKEINGIEDDNTITEQQGIPVTITASLSGELTKVALTQDPDNADGAVKLTWAAGDKIRVASHADPTKFSELTLSSGAGDKTAEFSGELASGVVAPYDISYNSAGSSYNYAEQTQSADANTAHLKYIATLSGVNAYADVDFTEAWAKAHGNGTFVCSSVLRLRANLPAGVAATVKSVIIRASENWVDGGDQIKVTIGTTGDAGNDGIINVYATLPASASTLSANATMEVIFETSGHDYLRQLTKENIGGKTFEMGKVNAIKLNCNTVGSNVDYADFAGGSGVSSDPWLISNARQMQKVHVALVDNETKYFKLTEDINMSGETWAQLNTTSPYNKLINFDGNNKTISNLGGTMFYVFKGSIKDVTFDGSTITPANKKGVLAGFIQGTGNYITNVDACNVSSFDGSNGPCGGLVGLVNSGSDGVVSATFEDCDVTNVLVNSAGSSGCAGGLIGKVDAKVVLTNCTRTGSSVANTYDSVGGLIGDATAEFTITNCSVENTNISGRYYVGGLVGRETVASGKTTSISKCSYKNSGTGISGTSYVGGLLGNKYGEGTVNITDCYVNSPIAASGAWAGGISSNHNKGTMTIDKCYVMGSIEASYGAGGIVGQVNTANLTINPVAVYVTSIKAKATDSNPHESSGTIVAYGKNVKVTIVRNCWYDQTLTFSECSGNSGNPSTWTPAKQGGLTNATISGGTPHDKIYPYWGRNTDPSIYPLNKMMKEIISCSDDVWDLTANPPTLK